MPLKVLIVGASIAGPTLAHFLTKTGAHIKVIERFPSFRPGGQNIDIRSCGVTVMRKMGIEPAVRANTLELDGMAFVSKDGSPYGILRSSGNPDKQNLLSEYEIYRGDLAKIMYDMTKDKVEYVFDQQVVSMKEHESGMEVEFARGQKEEFDLVVACDGATSKTRGMGLGVGRRDGVHPVRFWAAYFSIPKPLGGTIGLGYSAVGGRAISLKPDGKSTRVVLWGIGDSVENFREAKDIKQFIYKHFQGVGWRTDEVLEAMMEAKDFYASEIVQVKSPLYRGRFALCGDAGYAAGPTGGGTSLAMAGAYILAGEIGHHGLEGLKTYEERMRPIIDDLQKIPPGVPGLMAPQTAWGIWIRNMVFMIIARTRLSELGHLWASGLEGDKYGLPDYQRADDKEEV